VNELNHLHAPARNGNTLAVTKPLYNEMGGAQQQAFWEDPKRQNWDTMFALFQRFNGVVLLQSNLEGMIGDWMFCTWVGVCYDLWSHVLSR
jgi:hypothetical protein